MHVNDASQVSAAVAALRGAIPEPPLRGGVAAVAEASSLLLEAASCAWPHMRIRSLRDVLHVSNAKLTSSQSRLVKQIHAAYSLLRHVPDEHIRGQARAVAHVLKGGDGSKMPQPSPDENEAHFDPWAPAARARGLWSPPRRPVAPASVATRVGEECGYEPVGGPCGDGHAGADPDANYVASENATGDLRDRIAEREQAKLVTRMEALEAAVPQALALRLANIERKLGDVALGDLLRAVQSAAAAQAARADALETKIKLAHQKSDILEAQVRAFDRVLAERAEARDHHGGLAASVEALRLDVHELQGRMREMERDLDDEVLRRAGVDPPPDAELSPPDAASLMGEPSFALLGGSDLCAARASSRRAGDPGPQG